MLNISLFTLFLITSSVNIASPGIGFVLLMGISLQHGWKRCLIPAFGLGIGIGILFSVALSGIGVIIASSPFLFSIIKLLGALFLFYLAWKAWHKPVINTDPLAIASEDSIKEETYFLKAIVVSLTNPQPMVFGLSVFPQFIDLNRPFIPQVTVMIAVYIVLVFIFGMLYAVMASVMRPFLQGETGSRIINRSIAFVFATIGCLVLGMAVSPWLHLLWQSLSFR